MKKPRYNLTKENCHCCHSPLQRDMVNGTEKCAHHTVLSVMSVSQFRL